MKKRGKKLSLSKNVVRKLGQVTGGAVQQDGGPKERHNSYAPNSGCYCSIATQGGTCHTDGNCAGSEACGGVSDLC